MTVPWHYFSSISDITNIILAIPDMSVLLNSLYVELFNPSLCFCAADHLDKG